MSTTYNCLNYFGQPGSDNDNTYYGNGTNIIPIIGKTDKTGLTKVYGSLKIDCQPTGGSSADYAYQIRSESKKASGALWGIDCETHIKINSTASIKSIQGIAVLDATFTATNATYIGVYAQARADGTFTGSGFLVAQYALIGASAAITAFHVCSQWLDSHQAEAVTGSHQLAYWTNNGAAIMDEALYLYGGDKITAFVSFDTCGTMVAVATGESMTITKKILINVDGTPLYLQAGTMA